MELLRTPGPTLPDGVSLVDARPRGTAVRLVRYWDASAIVPVLHRRATKLGAVSRMLEQDPQVVVWWSTEVECVSAIARLEREGHPRRRGTSSTAFARLEELADRWQEIEPASRLRQVAERACFASIRFGPPTPSSSPRPSSRRTGARETLPFVTLDDRLARAAEREGFPVVEPA